MVDKELILKRVEYIDKHLDRIVPYKGLSLEEFLENITAQDIVEYNLFQIVNHLIDIIQHIVVDEGYGMPQSAYDAVLLISRQGILGERDVVLLKKMIGFRNVIGHDYIDVDKSIVYSILTKSMEDIKNIVAKIIERFI